MKKGLGTRGSGLGEKRKRNLSSPVPSPQFPTPSFKRYAKVAGAAAKVGAGTVRNRIQGGGSAGEAIIWRAALGGLKGPLMKVAQLLASIPDFLPREFAAELATLQSDAPPMGPAFARQRMAAELGPDWQKKFRSFDQESAFAASLGQVHRAESLDGQKLACKLQYPDMDAVVEADLRQLKLIFSLIERFSGSLRAKEAYAEIAERLREELDYEREANNIALYEKMLEDAPFAHVPRARSELSTPRLLSMEWMEGERFLDAAARRGQGDRNKIAENMFRIWYQPFYSYGVIHGDPHLGNYTIREDASINLLDFGCIRIFTPELVQAVVMMFEALRDNDKEKEADSYRLWGFEEMTKELLAALGLWARFVYAPLLTDRIQPIEETNATAQGREVAGQVYRALKKTGGVTIPRPFVMIDRASIGLGGVFLRLKAEANWHRLFSEMIEDFGVDKIKNRQKALSIR